MGTSKDRSELSPGTPPIEVYRQTPPDQWEHLGFDREVIGRFFDENTLAALSLEEYIQFMRRFPSEMVTHVTRQGLRDHVGRKEHTVGKGEFHNGFTGMLADSKRLRSSVGSFVRGTPTPQNVLDFLQHVGLSQIEEYQKAIKIFEQFCNPTGIWQTYVDHAAIHMAAEDVADQLYGGETGNEIFVAFPSAHIASQHFHTGNLHERSSKVSMNDIWVWPQNPNGLYLDAGIVFIPASARVDPMTGSRYFRDSDGSPRVIDKDQQSNPVYAPAENTINSQDYWERYFELHPELRPKKIVYYNGTPVEGMDAWRDSVGLTKRLVTQLPPPATFQERLQRGNVNTTNVLPQYGFPEHQLPWEAVSTKPEVVGDLQAFRDAGHAALRSYYQVL